MSRHFFNTLFNTLLRLRLSLLRQHDRWVRAKVKSVHQPIGFSIRIYAPACRFCAIPTDGCVLKFSPSINLSVLSKLSIDAKRPQRKLRSFYFFKV